MLYIHSLFETSSPGESRGQEICEKLSLGQEISEISSPGRPPSSESQIAYIYTRIEHPRTLQFHESFNKIMKVSTFSLENCFPMQMSPFGVSNMLYIHSSFEPSSLGEVPGTRNR